jgi:protocatechuate 3,4-dioxygenase beta subunit
MSINPQSSSLQSHRSPLQSRRGFLTAVGIGATTIGVNRLFEPGVFAEELQRSLTAAVEEGPFYPTKLPLDTDNDLLVINDGITPAVGTITHLTGRVLDSSGNPIKNAELEIWQVDNLAVYLKDRPNQQKYDANFQGFGRFVTGLTGDYYFRTIKPVVYPGRLAPHIHFKVKIKGRPAWNTQLFIKGYADNARDGVFNRISTAALQETVTVDFTPIENSRIGELVANFDIALGVTQQD